jgi:putative proteasome-type protease
MTYCLSLLCREGIVFLSDSRTSAGVDNITVHPKMRIYACEGDRVLCLLSSGNLSITQSVAALIEEDIANSGPEGSLPCLLNRETLFETVRYVGEKVRAVRALDGAAMREAGIEFNINLILGGQIGGQPPQIYRIYSPGNAIHASRESPFLQIGETKYGKPVLDRGFTFDKTLNEAVRYGILSLDATAKSNVSVGTPFEAFCYEADSLEVRRRAVLHDNDPWLRRIRETWDAGLIELVREMPSPPF